MKTFIATVITVAMNDTRDHRGRYHGLHLRVLPGECALPVVSRRGRLPAGVRPGDPARGHHPGAELLTVIRWLSPASDPVITMAVVQ